MASGAKPRWVFRHPCGDNDNIFLFRSWHTADWRAINHGVVAGAVVFCILGVLVSHVLSSHGVCYGYSHVVPGVFSSFPRGTMVLLLSGRSVHSFSDPSVGARAFVLVLFSLLVLFYVWKWDCAVSFACVLLEPPSTGRV